MALADRVYAAELSESGDVSAPSAPTVDDLRRAVREFVSFESIASAAARNPRLARNELRAACARVLSGVAWKDVPSSEGARLTEELVDVVFGMGPLEGLIRDESITEIMVNGTHSIYIEREGKLMRSGSTFASDEQVRVLIDRIIGPLGRRIDEASPMVSARLPEGHRVNAVIPPISLDGPVLTIRMFARKTLTLAQMEQKGSLDKSLKVFFGWLVRGRKNVVVAGGTGSGKTTLLNALSRVIPFGERVVTIEDSAELRFDGHPHVVRLEARPRNVEGEGEVTIRSLVINALRMRPDRIVVGECRGEEALDMLQAMNTGHDGSLTTLHANSPADVVDRMITMVRYAVDLPTDAIEAQIGGAFDYVVQVVRSSDGMRYVSEVAEVSFDRDARRCRISSVYRRQPRSCRGLWLREPACVRAAEGEGLATNEEVEAWRALAGGACSPSCSDS